MTPRDTKTDCRHKTFLLFLDKTSNKGDVAKCWHLCTRCSRFKKGGNKFEISQAHDQAPVALPHLFLYHEPQSASRCNPHTHLHHRTSTTLKTQIMIQTLFLMIRKVLIYIHIFYTCLTQPPTDSDSSDEERSSKRPRQDTSGIQHKQLTEDEIEAKKK